MATFVVSGVDKIEYAPASAIGVVDSGDWKDIGELVSGTIKFTRNGGTKSSLVPEGRTAAFVNFFKPGDGDTLAIGLIQQDPAILDDLFNIDYTVATTTVDYQADEKIANLAFKITCKAAKDGRKAIITIFNTDTQTVYAENLTQDAVEQLLLTATLNTYRPAGKTKDYVYRKQFVLADGTTIDSTPPVG